MYWKYLPYIATIGHAPTPCSYFSQNTSETQHDQHHTTTYCKPDTICCHQKQQTKQKTNPGCLLQKVGINCNHVANYRHSRLFQWNYAGNTGPQPRITHSWQPISWCWGGHALYLGTWCRAQRPLQKPENLTILERRGHATVLQYVSSLGIRTQ